MGDAGRATAAPTVRARLSIRGRVQGVYFRASTAETARTLGIAGWVRNTSEGVEAVLEGPRPAVDQAVAWCRTGPPLAAVEDVDVTWEEPEGLHGFSIRY